MENHSGYHPDLGYRGGFIIKKGSMSSCSPSRFNAISVFSRKFSWDALCLGSMIEISQILDHDWGVS